MDDTYTEVTGFHAEYLNKIDKELSECTTTAEMFIVLRQHYAVIQSLSLRQIKAMSLLNQPPETFLDVLKKDVLLTVEQLQKESKF